MTLRKLAWWGSHRVAAGSPDIRGWRVQDGAGVELGTIADLLFDDARGLVRYVALRLADEKLLVPIAALELRPGDRTAILIGGHSDLAMDRRIHADVRHQN